MVASVNLRYKEFITLNLRKRLLCII